MSLMRWSDVTSLLFAIYACWLLLSQEGKARIATKEWIPTLIALGAVTLGGLHLALTYPELRRPVSRLLHFANVLWARALHID